MRSFPLYELRERQNGYWVPVYLEVFIDFWKHFQSLNYFLLFLQWKTGHHSIGSSRFFSGKGNILYCSWLLPQGPGFTGVLETAYRAVPAANDPEGTQGGGGNAGHQERGTEKGNGKSGKPNTASHSHFSPAPKRCTHFIAVSVA